MSHQNPAFPLSGAQVWSKLADGRSLRYKLTRVVVVPPVKDDGLLEESSTQHEGSAVPSCEQSIWTTPPMGKDLYWLLGLA